MQHEIRLHVPGLGFSEMQVVDAVEVHILGVPGEAGLPHAEVQVRGVDSLDGDTTVLLDHVQDGVQVPDVPFLNVLTLHTHKKHDRELTLSVTSIINH